ncbi:NYN domain-containing protein [Brevundimonas sp.]|uniref:NYN domain-containing protein n=1 Tax=Brevundimonas sp. TaxID=1871086 RepID=UPI002ABB4EDF|nr:NYN domain-containing protein [Brevundimonas sp.]MDZ4363134.1 NYN domain-containing protein [Brevundimonas sp.]
MARASFFIDGFNLYHAIDKLNQPSLKWLNHRTLAASYLRPGDTLESVKFYTAVLTWEREKQKRHKTYLAALTAVGCTPVESRFARVSKHCRVMNRSCPRHEEKQTDVSIATDIIADAIEDHFDTAYLVTADSDQVPTVKTFRRLFPNKRIVQISPPGCDDGARELGAAANQRLTMSEGRLRANLLPSRIQISPKSFITIPSSYRVAAPRIV